MEFYRKLVRYVSEEIFVGHSRCEVPRGVQIQVEKDVRRTTPDHTITMVVYTMDVWAVYVRRIDVVDIFYLELHVQRRLVAGHQVISRIVNSRVVHIEALVVYTDAHQKI